MFSDRRSKLETDARKELTSRIKVLRNAKNVCQNCIVDEHGFNDEHYITEVVKSLAKSLALISRLLEDNDMNEIDGDDNELDDMEILNSLEDSEIAFNKIKALSGQDRIILELSLKALIKGMDYWKNFENDYPHGHAHFLIENWLTGMTPPPQCKGSYGMVCLESASKQDSYCIRHHNCQSRNHPGCGNIRDDSVQNAIVCARHRCQSTTSPCDKEVLSDTSAYCFDHACPHCLGLGVSSPSRACGSRRSLTRIASSSCIKAVGRGRERNFARYSLRMVVPPFFLFPQG